MENEMEVLKSKFKKSKSQDNFFYKNKVSEQFIENHLEEINVMGWLTISYFQNLTWDFFKKHEKRLNITSVFIKNEFICDFDKVKEYENKLEWSSISYSPYFSSVDNMNRFFSVFSHKIDWASVSTNGELIQRMDDQTIERYADLLHWSGICYSRKMSPEFMDKYANKLDWEQVSRKQKLTTWFIDKYADKLNWQVLLGRCSLRLSSNFLEKHIDKIEKEDVWGSLFYQNLNNDFIKKYQNKLKNWKTGLRRFQIDEEILLNQLKNFNDTEWHWISLRQKISSNFVMKNIEKIDTIMLKYNEKVNQKELEKSGVYVMATLLGKGL